MCVILGYRKTRRTGLLTKMISDWNGDFSDAREALIAEIEAEVVETRGFLGIDRIDSKVFQAMRAVRREDFVPESVRDLAYVNRPLAIGHGQTISQPFIVAAMTNALALSPSDRVLEIGTGCGYQTAVLAHLARHVYTVEVIERLGQSARARLTAQGYGNIDFRIGDGWRGWAEHAPYDAIIVTAAAPEPPATLIDQLAEGARMIVPIGPTGGTQRLTRIEKRPGGELHSSGFLPVAFVPLIKTR